MNSRKPSTTSNIFIANFSAFSAAPRAEKYAEKQGAKKPRAEKKLMISRLGT
jgi:hypothetical protein